MGKIPKFSGVAIVIKQNLNIETHTISKDEEGRVISLTFTFENQNFQIINIYGPTKNSEKHTFYKQLHKYITQTENIILGGDFNMVEDLLLDRQGGNPNTTHTLGLNSLTKTKQKYNLTDIWRKENPDKKLFTYHNKFQQILSRIDRFYLLQNQQIKNTAITPNNLSDHDAITLILKIKKTTQKRLGYWSSTLPYYNKNIFKNYSNAFGEIGNLSQKTMLC